MIEGNGGTHYRNVAAWVLSESGWLDRQKSAALQQVQIGILAERQMVDEEIHRLRGVREALIGAAQWVAGEQLQILIRTTAVPSACWKVRGK